MSHGRCWRLMRLHGEMKANAKRTTVKVWNSKQLPPDWFKRQQADQKATADLENNVKAIINQVKTEGDKALLEFALKFDKAKLTPETLKVSPEEIKEAYNKSAKNKLPPLNS